MNTVEKEYQEALDFIYSFVDFSLTRSLKFTEEQFNLARMRELMHLLGDPQKDYPCIHVAGTKGKGSTSALMASVLKASGYHTGLYTSPHLWDFTERIQINNKLMRHEEFIDLLNELRPFISKVEKLTTFEITTALAFWYFSKKKVDIAVIEVGLGGRLDATNVLDPLVSVITPISLDHVHILGGTLEQIAGEKGGIIKPGRPVVTSRQKSEAAQVFEKIAEERQSPLIQVEKKYEFKSLEHSLSGQTFSIREKNQKVSQAETYYLPLLGKHQIENAVTAYGGLAVANQKGIKITADGLKKGFKEVFWPVRFEVIKQNPVVIIDSAHNRDSAARLRETLDDYLPGKPILLVFGTSEDKDIEGMILELAPRVNQLVATRSIHPRAMDPEIIVKTAQKSAIPVKIVEPIEEALHYALETAGQEMVVLVAGSLFVSAAVREVLMKMGLPLRTY